MAAHLHHDANAGSRRRWGWGLSVPAVLFLVFDGVIKLVPGFPPVVESFTRLGYAPDAGSGIGVLELACVALYVVPGSAILGAILMTGYLGGAVATHVRVGDPLLSHVLFPAYVALLLWGGLFLREARLRALVPFRTTPKS